MMRCLHCNEKLAIHDLWCINCGKRTSVLSKDLSALNSLNDSWKKYKKIKGKNFPMGIWASLLGILPMFILIFILNFTLSEMPKWQIMILSNVVWLIFIPILLVPFQAVCKKDGYHISVQEYFASFSRYFHYLMFSLSSVGFYLIIFFICKGDPILNLVWLVLVFYWIAIVFPVPVLMERFNINSLQAIKLAYKHAGDIRWNMFLMAIVLVITNILALAFFVIGLIISVPFTFFAIRDYVDKLIEFDIFDTKGKV